MKRVISLLALMLAGCSGKPKEVAFEPPPVPVLASRAEVRDVSLYLEAMGIVKASQTVDIKPQVTGKITGVHFTEGSLIQEGDLLYTIEPAPYEIRVREMKAHLAQNTAHLSNVKKKLERFRTLSKQDLIAQVEWDEVETQVSLYKALVQADSARVRLAKLDLEHCRILSPITGIAGKVVMHAGNIADGSALVTLSQIDPLYVEFNVTEGELAHINSWDLPIEVFLSGSDTRIALGKVSFVDPSINQKTGMLLVRGQIDQLKQQVRPGQSVRVHLIYGRQEQSVMVPLKAIKTNQQGTYVFSIKDDNTVESRPVKLGREEKGMIVVEDGVDWGDKVVTEGHSRLFPGSKVEEKK